MIEIEFSIHWSTIICAIISSTIFFISVKKTKENSGLSMFLGIPFCLMIWLAYFIYW